MKYSTIKPEKGIGLIEVLVTTVVVAVGLLAVASLQGTFVSSSGESKTRSEALVLAEQKLESLRNNVTSTGYSALASGTDSPVGTNATFTRTWTITDVTPFTTGAPDRKNISVQVGWDGNGDGDSTDADEIVNVVTELAWNDPAKASSYAASNSSGGTSSVASPRQNASEDAASENVIGTGLEITDLVPATAGSVSVDNILSVTIPGDGGQTITLTQIAPESHYYTATRSELSTIEEGVIAVFLCGDDNTCSHIQNHFGGVVHRISGTVHSTSSNGFTDIKVAWTSSSVSDCYNGPVTNISTSGTNQYRTMPYECVYAGNCDETADGVNRCFAHTVVSDDDIEDRNVGPGGEYGDVGLLGVDDQGGDREQVCFLEDTVDPATSPLLTAGGGEVLNEAYLYSVTKRFYSARRVKRNGSINDQKSEGINHSYTNHNFLVVSRGTGATANQICSLKATSPYTGYSSIQLAPREIFKTLDEGVDNTVVAEAAYTGAAGTAKTLTGNVTASRTNLKLIIPDLGNCYLNNNSSGANATAYACAVPSDTVSIDIKGGSNEYPALSPSVFASCTKTDATTCDWPANFSATAVASDNCTAPWGDAVTDGDHVTAYLSENEPYGNVAVSPNTCQDAEIRTCTAGTLSGSYTNETCSIAATANCTAPWGAAVTNGNSVTAYDTASVPYGFVCSSHTRTCTNGILSGSGNYGGCTTQSTRDISVSTTTTGTGSVSGVSVSGLDATCVGMTCTVDNAWTGSLTATGTCSGSPATVSASVVVASPTATTANIIFPACAGPACTTPWSSSVASGGSVAAYLASSVLSPSTCSSETRYCNDGVLSGTYTNQSCTVIPTYSVTAVPANNGSGSVTTTTCNGGSCSGLIAGTYTVAVALSGGNTCSKSYAITGNTTVSVTKDNSGTCTMTP
jgi:type IV pilus modification protein PilV